MGRPARHALLVGLLAITSFPLVACAEDRPEAATTNRPIAVTRVHRYTDLAALRRDSRSVILARATASRTGERDGFPMTITTVSVTTVVGGDTPPPQFEIRQLGTDRTPSPDTSQLMRVDRTYLLFVRPDQSDPARPLGITGDDGIYVVEGGGYVFAGGFGGKLPPTLDEATVASLAQAPPPASPSPSPGRSG
ncbi:hypothetical protein Val02_02730 [Virgisporangium aliadipatigenens]|uniref:Lipoprotein n=1 Tax=Virgisporangium aliadipatigenens TaxID=741659 RepID=A0A8J3YFM9_9ACTN|nr:hypothetical protein [Virgisporangium aliadipatigenens]GIJ43387.1 hypothetical protein Val02_02730 [Virgisporangium aliadipatigenens]